MRRALAEVLPDLVRDLESALLRIGRGDVVDQLREVEIERWTYDDFADAVDLYLGPPGQSSPREQQGGEGETVSVYDDLGINLDLDRHRRLTKMEILEARAIASRLGAVVPNTPDKGNDQ